MTEIELKMILKLIDMRTHSEEYAYGCYRQVIDLKAIKSLKQDIKDLFTENKEETK